MIPKRLLPLALVSLLLPAGPALAVVHDAIGVYADAQGTTPCVEAAGALTCHVVLANPSDPAGINGWQFALRIDGGGFVFAPQVPVNHINVRNFPEMMLGCATPIPAAAAMVLMTFSAWAPGPASIRIDQLSSDEPVLVLLATDSTMHQPGYAYGGHGAPVFAMGGATCPERNTEAGVVAVERQAWGGLKARFR